MELVDVSSVLLLGSPVLLNISCLVHCCIAADQSLELESLFG